MGSTNHPSSSSTMTPKEELTLLNRKWETTLSNQNFQSGPLLSFFYLLDVARVNVTTLSILNQNMSAKTRSTDLFMYG